MINDEQIEKASEYGNKVRHKTEIHPLKMGYRTSYAINDISY
jgi:hypothetical protein